MSRGWGELDGRNLAGWVVTMMVIVMVKMMVTLTVMIKLVIIGYHDGYHDGHLQADEDQTMSSKWFAGEDEGGPGCDLYRFNCPVGYWLYRCLHHDIGYTGSNDIVEMFLFHATVTSGILGLVLQYITPLTIAPSVAMIGLRWIKTVLQRLVLFHLNAILDSFYAFFSLFDTAAMNAAQHWGVSMAWVKLHKFQVVKSQMTFNAMPVAFSCYL